MTARVLGVALLALACRRTATVAPDPAAPVDASPPKPAPTMSSRLALHGRIVDGRSGDVVFPLRAKTPRDEASDERNAYVLDDDEMVRAYDLATGKLLWEAKTGGRRLALGARRVFSAGGGAVVHAVDKTTGATAAISTKPAEEIHAVDDTAVSRSGADVLIGGTSIAAPPHIEARIDDYRSALAPVAHGVCFLVFTAPDFELRCFDLAAKETVHTVHALAKPGDPPGARFHFIAATAHHAIVGTHTFGSAGTRRAIVIRLSDGKEVMRVEDELVAIVEDHGVLEGALTAEVKMYAPSGAVKWSFKPTWPEHFVKLLPVDDRLVLARHNVIATGVDVVALRRTDGALLWTGETKLPPIGHSKYHNHVTLETRADAVVLRGHESSVEHVHVYAAGSGELRYHDP